MAEDVTPLFCPDEESKGGCLLASGERADSGNHPVAASVLCLHNSSPLGYEGCHCIPVGNQHGNRLGDPGDSQGKLFSLALSSKSSTAIPESWRSWHSPLAHRTFSLGILNR